MSSLYTSDPRNGTLLSAPKASLSRLRAAALPPVMRFVHHIDRKTLLTLPANKAIIDTDIIICLKCRHRNAARRGHVFAAASPAQKGVREWMKKTAPAPKTA
jgi:hypothetical protein